LRAEPQKAPIEKFGLSGVIDQWNQAIQQLLSMKNISIKFLLAAAAMVSVTVALIADSQKAPASNAAPPDIEKAILARLNDIQSAGQALDADKVFSFVLENDAGVIAQNGRVFLTRSNALDSLRQSYESFRNTGARLDYHFDSQHVTLLSPSIALAIGEGTTSVRSEDGRNTKVPFAQSVLLVLTNGDWKVFHAHYSIAPLLQ
jgi:hypothetical protein